MKAQIEAQGAYTQPDGVTPPMRKARQRHFKPMITLPQAHMQEAVRDVMEMLAGRCVLLMYRAWRLGMVG